MTIFGSEAKQTEGIQWTRLCTATDADRQTVREPAADLTGGQLKHEARPSLR